jgi:hypothetical protein
VKLYLMILEAGQVSRVCVSKNLLVGSMVVEETGSGWVRSEENEVWKSPFVFAPPGFEISYIGIHGGPAMFSCFKQLVDQRKEGGVGVWAREMCMLDIRGSTEKTFFVNVGMVWTPDEDVMKADDGWKEQADLKSLWRAIPRNFCLDCSGFLEAGKKHDRRKCVVRSVMNL